MKLLVLAGGPAGLNAALETGELGRDVALVEVERVGGTSRNDRPRRRFTHELVPTGSFTDPEYGVVGLTEGQARERYDCEVGMARDQDLVRPVIDDHPLGFCKLIVESDRRYVLGAHVRGEYSAEVIQTASACMAAKLRIEQIAELVPAFPTFTEAITAAAQTIVRQMGIAPSGPTWGEVRAADTPPRV